MKKIISIIGARPQFIKHISVQKELQKVFDALTIHTGQHYDKNMSALFFDQLNIPLPDFQFEIGGSKPQGEQTGIMMTKIEKVCLNEAPDAMLIYGDTNSTLAGALVAAKMNIKLIHIEAGLRSFNRTMPEEINRIIADRFSDLLFCPTSNSIDNLKNEGVDHSNIYLSGDVMCDTLYLVKDRINKRLFNKPYYFSTIHRPYNTDKKYRLQSVLSSLNSLDKTIVFPVHPRVKNRMAAFKIDTISYPNISFIDPVGYIESLSYQKYAQAVITDSGGIQKEAYMLKKKCVTIRSETEWTETLRNGWNTLIFDDLSSLNEEVGKPCGTYEENLFGNGHAAVDITKKIREII